MAASGFTPISLYYSTTASAVPTSGNLANGELALNIADMKLYAKNSAGAVTLLASSGGATGTVSSVAATVPAFLSITGSPITTSGTLAISLSGSALPTTSGGTGLTSFNANGVVYASSSSVLATSSAFTFDGSTLSLTGVQTITNSSGSTLTLNRTGNPGSLQLNYDGTQTGQIQAVSGGGLVFYQGSSPTEGMRLTSTGLGVGTNSPVAELEVFNPAVNTAFVPNTLSTWRVAQIRNDQTGTSGSAAGLAFVGTSSTQPAGIVAINSNTTGGIVSLGFLTVDSNTVQESFRFGPVGQFGIGGANYGLAGQVLTSGGASAAPTWASAGGGSGFTAKTTNYTAASGDNILANTSSGSWTLTLPASPSTGNAVQVMDSIGTFGTYPLTVARNGSTIMSAAEDMTMAVNGAATTFVYNGSTWRVI